MTRQILLSFTLLYCLQSCIKESNMQISNTDSQLVIGSLFSPDTLLQVYVGKTSSMNEQPNFIEDASILVTQNGQSIGVLEYLGEGWYRSNHYPEEGVKYRIEVSVPNYEQVWAESEVPINPEIVGVPYAKRVGIMNVNQTSTLVYDTYFSFLDSDIHVDYYEIFMSLMNLDFDRIDDPSIRMDSNFDIPNVVETIVFSDVLFNGLVKDMHLPSFGSANPEDTWFSPIWLRFHSVSKEYFMYRRSLYRHIHLQNTSFYVNDPLTLLFLGEPIDLYTNIHGGTGIFAGFNSKLIYVERLD